MKLQIPMKLTAHRWLMLSPALAVIGVLFAGGLALVGAQSLGYFAPTGENAFRLRHYDALSHDREVYASLWLTLKLTTPATVISAVWALTSVLGFREVGELQQRLRLT